MTQAVVKVDEETIRLLNCPTETVTIRWTWTNDDADDNQRLPPPLDAPPHTIILFVPGNPGLVHWYIPMLVGIIDRLGPGYIAHGTSHAGHSTRAELIHVAAPPLSQDPMPQDLSWTMEGQVRHKIAYMDHVLRTSQRQSLSSSSSAAESQVDEPRLIFISHSIGAYFTQQLRLLRPDILHRTRLFLHLMPFIRMQAPRVAQTMMDLMAAVKPEYSTLLPRILMRLLSQLPISTVDTILKQSMADAKSRAIAVELVRQPEFARNFLELGCREIQQVPRSLETSALRFLATDASMVMLFANDDYWAPRSLVNDIQRLQRQSLLPANISTQYNDKLKHDFVSHLDQTALVVDFCVEQIQASSTVTRSKL